MAEPTMSNLLSDLHAATNEHTRAELELQRAIQRRDHQAERVERALIALNQYTDGLLERIKEQENRRVGA